MSATALLARHAQRRASCASSSPCSPPPGLTLVSLDELGDRGVGRGERPRGVSTRSRRTRWSKARYFHEVSGGIPTVADDSGLEVDALGGTPGVQSKRWSGRTDLRGAALDEANNGAAAVAGGVDSVRRRATCASRRSSPSGVELVARGETAGTIVRDAPRARRVWLRSLLSSAELGRTFGESEHGEKERVSHRGRAFRAAARTHSGRAVDHVSRSN